MGLPQADLNPSSFCMSFQFSIDFLPVYEVVMRIEEVESIICCRNSCKTSHGFAALLVVLMVSLNAVVIVLQSISFCLDEHAMRKQGDTPKIFVESFLVVGKLVSHEAYFSAVLFPRNELRETEVLDVLEQGLRACSVIS